MTAERAGGVLLIVGSVVFFVGAAIGVPGVFTQTDPQVGSGALLAASCWVLAVGAVS